MLTQLSFERFRGFKHFESPLGPMTCVLGPNSSGKTSVLYAVRLACDLLQLALSDVSIAPRLDHRQGPPWIVVADGMLWSDPSKLTALADWRALFVDQVVGEGVQFAIRMEFEPTDLLQAVWTEVSCARNGQLKCTITVRSAQALERVSTLPKKSKHIPQYLTDFLKKSAPIAILVPPFYGTVPNEEYRSKIVIDRLLGSGDQNRVVRNLVSGLSADRFERLNSFLADTIGAKLVYRTSGDDIHTESPLRVSFSDGNGELELSAAGAGLINLVALYSALARWRLDTQPARSVIFLLDEPEAHLHPRLQAESASRLARLVTKEFGAQLLFATHSIDILNRLFLDGALLFRVDRGATPSVTPLNNDSKLFEDLSHWADLTPYTAINFLASRRILFCEGPSDAAILSRLGALRFRNDPVALRAFQRWAIVRLDGSGNERIAGLLNRLLASQALRVGANPQPFEILVMLDRDYSRTPGFSTQESDALTKLVLSRHSIESLFMDARVLAKWIDAFAGGAAPSLSELESLVEKALLHANLDAHLTREAQTKLSLDLISAQVRSGTSILADYGRPIAEQLQTASKWVEQQPEVWQRGKDRASFVLGELKQALKSPVKDHFPTSVQVLIERTDLNRMGDVSAAIPLELNTLLERMGRERPHTGL